MSAVLEQPVIEPSDGVHDDLPFGEYRRLERLSYSGAKVILRSAAHFVVSRTKPAPQTDAQRFGSAFHAELLEPGRVREMVVEIPADAPKRPSKTQLEAAKPSPKTLEAIAYWSDFDQRAGPRLQLDTAEAARLRAMLAAVRSHPGAMRLLSAGRAETSVLWTDARYGVPCKGRFDWLRPDGGIVDIKSTHDASPDAFARTAASFMYHMQVASYFSGCEHALNATPPFWAWVVVEDEEPYGVATYVAQPDAIMAGQALWDRALSTYRDCLDTGRWPAYPDTIDPLQFPTWALRARHL